MKNYQVNQPVPINLMLPQSVINAIEDKMMQYSLKRGSMTRLYLAEGLKVFQVDRDVNVLFNNWKSNEPLISVGLQITTEMNGQLIQMVREYPISKKRLSELIVALAVTKEIL